MKVDKAPTKVFREYADFAEIFSLKLIAESLKYTKINNHAIKLVNDWQSLYNLIYSLGPMELEILKTYIKNNLASNFIKPFKFLTRALIFFDKKSDESLRLYIDY